MLGITSLCVSGKTLNAFNSLAFRGCFPIYTAMEVGMLAFNSGMLIMKTRKIA